VIASKFVGIFLTVCLTGGTFFLVYYTVNNSVAINKEFALGTSLILTGCQSAIPILVQQIVGLEGWSKPEDKMFQLLWRTYVLKMMNVVIVVLGLQSAEDRTGCKEADMATQLLNLIFIDFAAKIASDPIIGFVTVKLTGAKVQVDHGIVAQYYIDMYYRQALIWVSVPYFPWAPIYGFATQFVIFYVMMFCFSQFYTAAEQPFEDTSGVGTLIVMMLTIVVAFFPQAFWLSSKPNSCGPINLQTGATVARYQTLVDWVYEESPEAVKNMFQMVLNPIIVYSLCIASFYVIGLLSSNVAGQKKTLEEERKQGKVALTMWRDEFSANKANQALIASLPPVPGT